MGISFLKEEAASLIAFIVNLFVPSKINTSRTEDLFTAYHISDSELPREPSHSSDWQERWETSVSETAQWLEALAVIGCPELWPQPH
jgi:hypothetical protein